MQSRDADDDADADDFYEVLQPADKKFCNLSAEFLRMLGTDHQLDSPINSLRWKIHFHFFLDEFIEVENALSIFWINSLRWKMHFQFVWINSLRWKIHFYFFRIINPEKVKVNFKFIEVKNAFSLFLILISSLAALAAE